MADDMFEDDLRADARYVLRDALGWCLRADRWVVVAAGVGAVRRALLAHDVSGLRTALRQLERMGPTRGVGFDEEPAQAPDDVRTEINELIHTLDGREAGD